MAKVFANAPRTGGGRVQDRLIRSDEYALVRLTAGEAGHLGKYSRVIVPGTLACVALGEAAGRLLLSHLGGGP